jgi:hypothetical protein
MMDRVTILTIEYVRIIKRFLYFVILLVIRYACIRIYIYMYICIIYICTSTYTYINILYNLLFITFWPEFRFCSKYT